MCSLKPTWGRVSVDGVLPLAPSLDHIGVMANCVRDLAIVFEAIAGPMSACVSQVDSGLDELELFRLGEYFDNADPELLRTYRDALRTDGAVEQLTLPPGFADVPPAHLTVMATEAAGVHSVRLDRHPDDYPPRIRELIETGRSRSATELHAASEHGTKILRRLRKRLGRFTVLATPATTNYAPSVETTGSPAFNSPWSFLGLPVVSVPCGWSSDGLPMAAQFIAASENEPQLLAAGEWAERQFGFPRRLPPVPAA